MKRMICREWPLLLIVAIGSACALPGLSRESQSGSGTNALTLEDAIRLALENNPQLRAAGGRVGSAAGRAYQSKLWPNPDFELSAEEWPLGGGGFADSQRLVGMSQTVPFPGKKRLEGRIGSLGVRVSEAQYDLERVELVRDVKTSFFEVLAAGRLVEVSRELVGVAESLATTARKRVQAGAAPDQEQLRAEIPLEEARTELAGFERDQETAQQKLARVLGCPELTAVSLSGALAEKADMSVLSQGPESWLAKHPSVVAARTSKERAEVELRRARLEPYPDVKLGAAGGQDSGGGGSIVQFTISVPMPILDSSKGRKLEARANVVVAEAEQATIEQKLLRDWGATSKRLRTAAEQVANYRDRILPKSSEALRLLQRGFEEGKFGFIDLLDTQRTTAQARLAYQQKLLELNVAQADIEALLVRVPGESTAANHLQPQDRK